MNEVEALFKRAEELYSSRIDTVSLKRGEYLLQQGQIERFTYLVLDGALVVKYYERDESHTIRFGYKGSYLNSIPSFFDGSPSVFAIMAIRKTEVKRFPKSVLLDLMESEVKWRTTYARILENLTSQFVEREIDLLTATPAERYKRVKERSPELFEEIPLRHIADYLRMTPETLSRLRKS